MTTPTPQRVIPLTTTLGEVASQRLDVLSAEVWDTWWDLRFARVATHADAPTLPRRVPPSDAWQVVDDAGTSYEVVDAVGRGDRGFSNGEVRLRPSLPATARWIEVTVRVGPGMVSGRIGL